MRVIMTCGGTGGHINPAIAIADIIKKREVAADILFVGSEGGMEERLVRNAGYELRTLRVMGLRRSLSLANIRAGYCAVRAVQRAKKELLAFAPDIVIGTGGFASYPMLRAAISCGIPCAAHESNAAPGLAIKRLAPRLSRVWLNFEITAESLPRASVKVVGNPLRSGFCKDVSISLPIGCRKMLLSFGGSVGAREINRAAIDLMEAERERPHVYHLHATGRAEYEMWKGEFQKRGLDRYRHLRLVPYIEDMAEHMAAATVVISRAGAMSISELAASGKCAILIPSPNVTGNHQYKNAKALADAGGAVLLVEEELSQKLQHTAFDLLSSDISRKKLEERIRSFYRPDADDRIFRDILRLIRKP